MKNKNIEKTPEKIQNLFNLIAPHYDQNNDIISLFMHRFVKKSVVEAIPEVSENAKILDLCTGTGDIAALLKKRFPSADITGVDFSDAMLKIARRKHKTINFVNADCLKLPFEDNSFDLVTISFGLRNTVSFDKALSEISRVLKPGGIFVHIDFGDANKHADRVFYELVKFIAELQGDDCYVYLLQSKNEFPPVEKLVELFARHELKYEMRRDYIFGIISAQYCIKI